MSILTASFRFLLLFVLLSVAAPAAQAQGGRNGQRLAQIENAKIAFITNRIALTQSEAQRFWPLYNEFAGRRRELNRTGRQLRRDVADTMNDQQIRDNFNQSFVVRQQEISLEKEYFERFQKVISLRQVAQLFLAERDFTKEVIKRVAGPGGSPQGPN